MSYTLQWPTDRGVFTERDPDRSPTGEVEEFRPGQVVEVDDVDVRDHYVDRGWNDVSDEDEVEDTPDEDPGMDWDTFANRGYEGRVAAVEAGHVDQYLDRIAEEDRSNNVQDAVEARQAEIQD